MSCTWTVREGLRSFCVLASQIWNTLPSQLKDINVNLLFNIIITVYVKSKDLAVGASCS